LFEELRALTVPLRGKPVTIRLLDVGGDKPVPFLPLPVEPNPSLGRRGVRLLLEYPQLVRTQLAALFRLAQEQDVRILVPMVTLEEDIREMRVLFDATLATFPGAKRPPFGAMIETPAAALGVATIARHVDFLSVGTNDLAQYTLAAGRDDPTVSRYYDDTHAAVLRLLAIAITDAPGVPIALCGELAGREETMPQLLRLGFRSLSMAPGLIPAAKELIRGVRLGAREAHETSRAGRSARVPTNRHTNPRPSAQRPSLIQECSMGARFPGRRALELAAARRLRTETTTQCRESCERKGHRLSDVD